MKQGVLSPDQRALLGLFTIHGIGPKTALTLLRHFGSAQSVLEAVPEAWAAVKGVGPAICEALTRGVDETLLDKVEALCVSHSIALRAPQELLRDDEALWGRVAELWPLLFMRGQIGEGWGTKPRIAIVGSRRIDDASLHLTQELTRELCALGCVIVSGGALGIDAAAHRAALSVGAPTIAVLGAGLDRAYPREHYDLFEQIVADDGLLLTEFLPGVAAEKGNFPRRNKLLAALCNGVVVARCGVNSGAMNTAKHAKRMGIPVMTLPGLPRDPLAAGPHLLIREGAHLVESAQEILSVVRGQRFEPQQQQLSLWSGAGPATHESPQGPSTGTARLAPGQWLQTALDSTDSDFHPLLRLLRDEPQSIDELAEQGEMSAAMVSSQLLHLELEGWVQATPGAGFCRK